MTNINIEFSMISLDSEARFTSVGELREDRIIFSDNEGNRHFIVLKQDSVEYHKRGSMNMKYTFNSNSKTRGTYEIDGNKFLFVIVTKELKIEKKEIIIKYDLLLDDEIINKSTLIIKYG